MNNKQSIKKWFGYKLLAGTIFILLVVQLCLTNYLSTLGMELANLSDQIQTTAEQNTILEAQMGSRMSLENVFSKATSLGMLKPHKVLFEEAPPAVALRSSQGNL